MKTSLTTFRRWATVGLVALVAFLSLSESAHAVQFTLSPSSPVTMRANNGSTVYRSVTVTNTSGASLSIVIDLIGSNHFTKYWQSRFFTVPLDSTATFQLSYHASAGDTSHAWLSVSDSISQWDTLAFTGIDTGHGSSGPNWSIYANNGFYMGSYYGKPDSANIRITNNTSSSVTVYASLNSNSYGMTIVHGTSKTIQGNGNASFTVRFNSSPDSAFGWVVFSDTSRRDSAMVRGRRSGQQQSYGNLAMPQTVNYDTVGSGDTLCKQIPLINRDSSKTIVLTSLSLTGDWMLSSPSLPVSILPGDTLLITVCYLAPQSYNHHSTGTLTAHYHFSNDSTNRTSSSSLHGWTYNCAQLLASTLYLEPVRVNGTVSGYLTIRNRTHVSKSISSVVFYYQDSLRFSVVSSLPLSIPADSSARLQIRFDAEDADTNVYYTYAYIHLSDTGCGTLMALILAEVDLTAVDSTVMPLRPDQEETLELEGDSASVTKQFRFYNNTNADIKVVGVSIDDTAHFAITDILPQDPEFTLGPGDTMTVSIHFDADSNGTFNANLIITTEGGLTTTIFHLVVHETGWVPPQSRVRRSGYTPLAISVSPNPAQGPVAIVVDGARTSTMEIVDVLGTVVARQVGQHWTWDRATSNASAGTYFVRVTGTDARGNAFVESRRIVLQR
jgi:hypothetical protein